MNEPWNPAAAMVHLAAVQRATAAKHLPPDHRQLEPLKAEVLRCLHGEDLGGVRAACGNMLTAIANLPDGRYDWDEALARAGEKKTASALPFRETPVRV
jgi:hypothetical protein